MAGGDSTPLLRQSPLIANILHESAGSRTPGERITSISSHFLNSPYVANSLVGDPVQAEQLVLGLDGFDCFTFLDTVEALRRSSAADDFPLQMIQVRYKDGVVSYENRRHFYTDWTTDRDSPVKDVTGIVGQGRERHVSKQLNEKSDGTLWLRGIEITPRTIAYIPVDELGASQLAALESGDYVGIYSPQPGLDVSHTGLIVKSDASIMFRHASSRAGAERVMDDDLMTYMRGKTGLIVYRVTQ